MPTVGQLLLIVVALAAPADMTIMCMELSGDPNLPRTMIAVTVDAINAALCSTMQPPRRPTAQQRSFVAMEEHTTVANFEPGTCHRTLEVGT